MAEAEREGRAMSTLGGTDAGRPTSARVMRAAPSGAPAVAPSTGASPALVETTAEIPAVAPGTPRGTGGREKAYGVLLPDGTVWYPDSGRRLPAPFALRLVVWLLFFVLVLGLAGLGVERVHPSWLDFLRNAPAGAPAVSSGPRTSPHGGQRAAGLHLVSSNATNVVYDTGTSSFRIVLRFANPDWIVVNSPAGTPNKVLAETLQPSASPKTVSVNGSASVIVSATTESISIEAGHKTLGTIGSPKLEVTYSFLPSGGLPRS